MGESEDRLLKKRFSELAARRTAGLLDANRLFIPCGAGPVTYPGASPSPLCWMADIFTQNAG